jgi:hypothetical protein
LIYSTSSIGSITKEHAFAIHRAILLEDTRAFGSGDPDDFRYVGRRIRRDRGWGGRGLVGTIVGRAQS